MPCSSMLLSAMALATSVGLALGTGTIKTEGGNVIISTGETGSVFVRKGSSIAPIIKVRV